MDREIVAGMHACIANVKKLLNLTDIMGHHDSISPVSKITNTENYPPDLNRIIILPQLQLSIGLSMAERRTLVSFTSF